MQLVKVSELIPHPRNNEFFDDVTGKRWDEFLESIKTSGVIEPIVVTQNRIIISGHQRVRACKELGIEEIMAEIRLYDDEKKAVKDLIETNVRQRGTISGSDQQIVARVEALKDWYGVHLGNNQHTKEGSANGEILNGENEPSTMEDILKVLGLSRKQYDTAKKITDKAIPEVQQLIDKGTVSRRTVADLIAKLSPEDQRALVDKLPDDVKLTAKTIEEHIANMRDEINGNAAKIAQEKDKLLGENERLARENNELRSGVTPENQEKIDTLEREKRDYYEKWSAAKKESERMRGEVQKALNAKARAEASIKGGDTAIIDLTNQVEDLKEQLLRAERKTNDLEYQLGEKKDEIDNLMREKKDGFMRKALRLNETEEEYSQRERDALISSIQIAIGTFQSSAEGFLIQKDTLGKIDKSILSVLIETCSQAINAGNRLKVALMAAGGPDVSNDSTNNDDLDLGA